MRKNKLSDLLINKDEEKLRQLTGDENPFKVPDNYFNQLGVEIISKVKNIPLITPWSQIIKIGLITLGGIAIVTSVWYFIHLFSVQNSPSQQSLIDSTAITSKTYPVVAINDANTNPVLLIGMNEETTKKAHVVINPQAKPDKIYQTIQKLPLEEETKEYIIKQYEGQISSSTSYSTVKSPTYIYVTDAEDATPINETTSTENDYVQDYSIFEMVPQDTCIESPVRLNAYSPGATSYKWSTGETNSTILIKESGTYRVTVSLSNGNAQIKSIRVKFIPKPKLSSSNLINGCLSEGVQLSAQQNSDDYTYEWPQFQSKESSVVTKVPGWYYVYVKGCKTYIDSFYVKLRHCDVYIPKAFTPNGDGINDYFIIGNLEKYPGTELRVYNRYNGLVYSSKDYRNDWNGENCEDGSYLYILRFPDGIIEEGVVTIHRK
ncbi:MAG: gliding motility-associated C-terminal domain-containing protein [Bacteroidales bacterium]|nr:gliding motility-associated C-terminal domain-containing protein [Bacteroidales bacterium]